MLRIIVHPAFDRRGRRLHGQFQARFEDHIEVLCTSHQPLLDSARVLLGQGADPADTIVMAHAGAAHDALRSTIGAAAKLTVEEGNTVSPTFRRWKPFSCRNVEPPMRFPDALAPDTGDSPERTYAGGAP